MSIHDHACGTPDHLSRRTLLQLGAAAGLSWLTPLGTVLARQHERGGRAARPKSVIVLWLEGGPSQLETFDPHPGTEIAAGSTAIDTRARGIQIGSGMPALAEHMDKVALVRSVTSKEGDHERAIYNVKTGFRPDPTVIHPALGAVVCHQTEGKDGKQVDIPRHVSILPTNAPARGGYLGDQFDAFKVGDPLQPVPDVRRRVSDERFDRRVRDLQNVIEPQFARGRGERFQLAQSVDRQMMNAALAMMSSEQLDAFDVTSEPKSLRDTYGDTPFGRGCLAATRLIEVGVRCVEVTLSGWDSHVNNHEIQGGLIEQLDPAFATLLADLEDRDLLQDTIVVCGGEFGRTPYMNPAGGRDHWPHGFSIAMAGGGIVGGRVIGATSDTPRNEPDTQGTDVVDPQPIENIHASILHQLGIDLEQELPTRIGRPMPINEGKVIEGLFDV